MEKRGVDQKTVAAQTGLSPTTVGKIYRNHFDRLDNHTITTLCKYFNCKKLDDLIELEVEPVALDTAQVSPPSDRSLTAAGGAR
jgi:putative transcriptional regulator